MQIKKMFGPIFPLVLLIVFPAAVCMAQNSKNDKYTEQAAKITGLVADQRYVFIAQSASPAKGGLIQLTSGYTLDVKVDTVQCDLPYYGRAYQAGYGSSDGGIKFTSVDMDYKVENRKKGGWNINIKPKDAVNFRELMLTIFADGTAMLNVNCNDRQPISFRGYITDKK